MCSWRENNHQAAKTRNNSRNMERSLSIRLGEVQELIYDLKHCRWNIVGFAEEKLPRMRDTIFGTAEKTRNASIGWHSVYGKKLYVVSSAALPSPEDSSLFGSQRDHTTSQSFRSMDQPQTMKMRRSNSSTNSLIVSHQRLPRRIYLPT